jgi:glycosyltransferase involved in cell wall biosynthesis
MQVKIDGIIYQNQSYGGVSRIFTEILPRMCDFDPTLQITIFTLGYCQQNIPSHSSIKHQSLFPVDDLLRPRRIWYPIQQPVRKLVQHLAIDNTSRAVWHSTYFTKPRNWNGPIVVTVYDMIHERFPDFFSSRNVDRFRKQKRSSVLAADSVICISETTLKDVQSYYGIDSAKLHAIPLAYNQVFRVLESDDKSKIFSGTKPFILYIGERGRYKNFKMLLQAYGIWQQRNEVDLLVVGRRWSDQERKWLFDCGCNEQVRLLEHIDDQALNCLYNQAQAFIYPSLFEGFGIPLLEAMASGCPIVASRIPSTLEVAGKQPFYFETKNIDSLLSALDLALMQGRKPSRVETGIKLAKRYSWNETAQKTLLVYRSLLDD